jgi:hypothetical protein
VPYCIVSCRVVWLRVVLGRFVLQSRDLLYMYLPADLFRRNPNHILLDFYDSNGNAPFDLAASLNSVSAPTNTVSAGSIATATTTGSTGTAQVSASKLSGAAVTGRLDLGLVLGMVLGVVGVMVGAGRVL